MRNLVPLLSACLLTTAMILTAAPAQASTVDTGHLSRHTAVRAMEQDLRDASRCDADVLLYNYKPHKAKS